jgi:hypothetical protein
MMKLERMQPASKHDARAYKDIYTVKLGRLQHKTDKLLEKLAKLRSSNAD